MKYQEITSKIIKCAYTAHKSLGFGFLENVYQNALMIELANADLYAEKEKKIQVLYNGQVVGDYIADIVVEKKIICELKSTKEINPAHEAQLVNCHIALHRGL
jgi:GxxExxY protein